MDRVYKIFNDRFKKEPSVLHFKNQNIKKESLETFFKKSHLIYVNKSVIRDDKIIEDELLVEYDSNGILIYIKSWFDIFIFTTTDRLNVAEFTLHNLIKLNKNGN